MTIKQQGGIFGRNPTFNDVTVDGTLTSNSISLTSLDNVPIGSSTPSTGAFTTLDANSGTFGQQSTGSGLLTGVSDEFSVGLNQDNGNTSNTQIWNAFTNGASSATYQVRYRSANDTGTAAVRFQVNGPTGDATINNGNLIIGTSGKGIDFSITSDGSGSTSSELFDDYEEGTFNPTYTTSGTDFDSVSYSVRYGNYVKIGSLIFVTGFIRTSSITVGSASGSVKIGGMPFARSGSMPPPGICQGDSWSGDVPRSCISFTDSTLGLYYRTGGNTADQAVQVADLDASGNNDLYFSCSFRESY